jgi:predicted ATPase/DNA-binding CsgD family transcriptional regulator
MVTMRAEPLGNLPQELTSFVGRRRELAEVKSLLAGSRLVTLVGMGGVGKTRLALQVAAGVRRGFAGGVWLVELDQLRDESLIAHAVARAFGLREQPGLAPDVMLSEYLAERRLLLVLDNCEHLINGVAKLVETLLRDTVELRILATSREPLHVEGETVYPVAPLTVPDPRRPMGLQQLVGYEAVALFAERATVAVAGFELNEAHHVAVAEICSRLDGLPLAIELAVARLRVLTPEQIRDRLSDRGLLTRGRRTASARQHTLRGCIEWSHDLCGDAERLLWARLSVFAGDFDLEAAEGVAADDELSAGDVLELVASLVDKSILVRAQEQGEVVGYRMLESIRTYGRHRLGEIGEEVLLRRRHRDWHRQVVARFQAEWIGAGQRDWLRYLDRRMPDITAALEFSLSDPQCPDAALAMAGDLHMYWGVSGFHHQARYWLDRALAPAGEPSPARLKALFFAASFAGAAGDLAEVTVRVRQAREVAEQLGDAHSRAEATAAEGRLAINRGDPAGAARLYTDALDVFRAQNDINWQAVSLINLTMTKALLGDLAGATAAHEAMLSICQPRGDSVLSGYTAMSLGVGLWKRGDLKAAATQLRQSLQLRRRIGNSMGTYWSLETTAWIAADRDQPEQSATLLGAAAAIADTMGTQAPMVSDLLTYHERYRQQVREALGEDGFAAAFEHGRSLSLDDAIAYALGEQPDRSGASPPSPLDAHADPMSTLTRREREVAALLAGGLSNKEIAKDLVLSPRTVEGHVDNILKKLNCTSRAQAAALIVTMAPDTDQGSS